MKEIVLEIMLEHKTMCEYDQVIQIRIEKKIYEEILKMSGNIRNLAIDILKNNKEEKNVIEYNFHISAQSHTLH